jgi:hypothetical protein
LADPLTIGMGAMAGLSMAGTGLQVKGQLDQADTYSRLADLDTQVANQNADYVTEAGEREAFYAEEQGQLSRQAGYEQAKEIRKEGGRLLAGQRALVGGSGVKVDTGSQLLVAAETARNVELDALTSEYEGRLSKAYAGRQAEASRVQSQREASEFRRQGRLMQYDKSLKKRSATYQTVGTIFGGITQAAAPFVSGSGGMFAGK